MKSSPGGVMPKDDPSVSAKKPVASIDLSRPKPSKSGFTPAIDDTRVPAYKRIVLKLSGEMLGGDSGKGIDPGQIQSLCEQIVELKDRVEIAVVIGGGNIIRGDAASKGGLLHRATADYMGMLATVMNALALQDALESLGADTRVMSAIKAEE